MGKIKFFPSFNIYHCNFLLILLNCDWYLFGGIKDEMQNDSAASKQKTPRHQIVFKRESYFSDAAAHFIILIGIVVSFIYFQGSSYMTYVYIFGSLIAIAWVLSIISLWQDYSISIITTDEGITEKHLRGGGWSYKWSEISEWNALLVGDGDKEIRFTTTVFKSKTYTLPIEKIGKNHYQSLKNVFIERCGKPTKIDSLMLANAPDDE